MPVRFVSASPTALQRLQPVAIVETNKLCGHTWRVKSVAISADGRTVASASSDKTICTWRASDGTKLQTLAGHTGEVTCVSFCVDGLLVSGSADKTLRLWAVSSEVQAEAKQVMETHTSMGVTFQKISCPHVEDGWCWYFPDNRVTRIGDFQALNATRTC